MKIKTLKLNNFQGIKELALNLDGHNAKIYGDNATGKTTIFNAFTWLLFDKPSTGAKNFTPKTMNAEGESHNLEHTAEVVLDVDGTSYTLKKVYREVYTQKRGSAVSEFTGHTTDYYINDVPAQAKAYNATVEGLCGGTETAKMLSMLDYFASGIDWSKRRAVLLEVCGDITDEDVFRQNADLARLEGILDGRSVEDYKKILAAEMKKLNQELTVAPARIDEAAKVLGDRPDVSVEIAEARIKHLKGEKDKALAEIATGAVEAPELKLLRDERKRLEERLREIQKKHRDAEQKRAEELRKELNEALDDERELNRYIDLHEDKRRAAESDKKSVEELRKKLQTEYADAKALVFNEASCACPYCKREYDAEKTTEMREAFNRERSEVLERIQARAKNEASNARIEELDSIIKSETKRVQELNGTLVEVLERVSELKADAPERPFVPSVEYSAIEQNLAAIKEEISIHEEKALGLRSADTSRLNLIDNEIAALQQTLARHEAYEAQEKRIAELERQMKQYGKDYIEREETLVLCEDFIKAKVSMLSDNINEKFESVRFRLFKDQVNGGISEDCEVLIPTKEGTLVPYSFANNAAKINAGLEIVDTLARHYKKSIPLFVDNAESVTRLKDLASTQIIQLIVSEQDKTLRIEEDR